MSPYDDDDDYGLKAIIINKVVKIIQQDGRLSEAVIRLFLLIHPSSLYSLAVI